MAIEALLLFLASSVAAIDYDVVVYGSTPAGIAAATASATLGMRVALYEPLKMIGGMGAAGNLALHDGGAGTGLARTFAMLNAEHYGVTAPVAQPESFVANASFYKMLSSAAVAKVALDCRLRSATTGAGGKLQSISVLCEREPVSATVFIDASYDGEIMVATGEIEYTSGREAISKYNESLAGARVPTPSRSRPVDALRDDGTLLKYVQNVSELAAPGESDGALMAFQHRLCISGDDDRVAWRKPAGYDRGDFLLFERYIEANDGKFNGFGWPPQNMHSFGYPGKKDKYTLCCGISIAASDQPNLNRGWANASWERKQAIISEHTYFELGMLYFLANDQKVPPAVRHEFGRYGLCADEFVEFGHIPPQLYIRESNRLVGDFVMTQNNIAKPRSRNDSIAVANWWLDKHMTGKYAPAPRNALVMHAPRTRRRNSRLLSATEHGEQVRSPNERRPTRRPARGQLPARQRDHAAIVRRAVQDDASEARHRHEPARSSLSLRLERRVRIDTHRDDANGRGLSGGGGRAAARRWQRCHRAGRRCLKGAGPPGGHLRPADPRRRLPAIAARPARHVL